MYMVHDVIDLDDGVVGVITEVHENAEIPMFDVRIEGDDTPAVTMIELPDSKIVPLAFFQGLSTNSDWNCVGK